MTYDHRTGLELERLGRRRVGMTADELEDLAVAQAVTDSQRRADELRRLTDAERRQRAQTYALILLVALIGVAVYLALGGDSPLASFAGA